MRYTLDTLPPTPKKCHVIKASKSHFNDFLSIKALCQDLASLQHKHAHICMDFTGVGVTRARKKQFIYCLSKHAFTFTKYKTRGTTGSKESTLHIRDNAETIPFWQRCLHAIECGDIARVLASEPSNILYPQAFVKETRTLFKGLEGLVNIQVIQGENALRKKGFGLITAVGQGSARQPCFMVIELVKGTKCKTTVLCGKGVCFDSGGVDLKPDSYGMHTDKTGAAIVVGLIHHCAQPTVDFEGKLVGLIPLVENVLDGRSYRPNDIITAYNGKTVEIVDTDAEGRLILADALAYAGKHWPKADLVIDFATLTQWASMLFCDSSFVYYTRNDRLAMRLEKLSEMAGERVIRMAKWPEYATYTRSKVADYKNAGFRCGDDSGAGSGFMAAMFLSNFVSKSLQDKWVHIDITHAHKVAGAPVSNANSFYTAIEMLVQ